MTRDGVPEDDRINPANGQGAHTEFPIVVYLGFWAMCAITVVAVWFCLEEVPWSLGGIGRLIASSVFGSLLLTGIMGTSLEMIPHRSVSRVTRTVRSAWGLFATGMALAFVSLLVVGSILSILAIGLDMAPLPSSQAKWAMFFVVGFASLALAAGIGVRVVVRMSRWWHQSKSSTTEQRR